MVRSLRASSVCDAEDAAVGVMRRCRLFRSYAAKALRFANRQSGPSTIRLSGHTGHLVQLAKISENSMNEAAWPSLSSGPFHGFAI